MTFIQTFTGKAFDLPAPKVEDVTLDDIAGPLSRTCRWNGQCRCFYSVAQHSLHVADLLHRSGASSRLQLIGLLHDAHEAYTGDIVSPLMRMLYVREGGSPTTPTKPEFVSMYGVQARISQVVFAALIPGMPDGCETLVEGRSWARADEQALLTEVRDLFAAPPVRDWTKGFDAKPAESRIQARDVEPVTGEHLFRERYETLRKRMEDEA